MAEISASLWNSKSADDCILFQQFWLTDPDQGHRVVAVATYAELPVRIQSVSDQLWPLEADGGSQQGSPED